MNRVFNFRLFSNKPVLNVLQSLLIVFIVILLTACSSTSQFTASAISAKQDISYQYGKFVWHDLLTPNLEQAQSFYAAVFGWRFRPIENNPYAVDIVNRGRVIGSIFLNFKQTEAAKQAIWLNSVSVKDVDKSVKAVLRLGGEIIEGPDDMVGRGRYALIRDSQAAALILLHSDQGDPISMKPGPGDWLWSELWTVDLAKAGYFYKKLFAYHSAAIASQEHIDYRVFQKDFVDRAGMLKIPLKDVKPNWLSYVKVSDLSKTLNKVREFGGQVFLAPDQTLADGKVAIIADPSGAVLAIQELLP